MKKIAILILTITTLFACRKDATQELNSTIDPEPTIVVIDDYNPLIENVTATVFGEIVNEYGVPMSNVDVHLGELTTTTNEQGIFLFSDETMNKKGTHITVNSEGFFLGSTRIYPKANSENYVRIKMMETLSVGNFQSNQGGIITTTDGIQIEFLDNSVVDQNDDLYNGQVEVAARWIDPTAESQSELMPGNRLGLNILNEEVSISSFGGMAVELMTPNGDPLNIGNNKNATLTFPIPLEMVDNAPAEIPLWYFHEDYGIWVQEGNASLQGDQYIGEVSHFSFWDCSAPFPLIYLSGSLLNSDGLPLGNLIVHVMSLSLNSAAYDWSENDGSFSGYVPQNEDLILTVFNGYNTGCENYQMDIGPFSADTDLGEIIIDDPEEIIVSGNLTCDGSPVDHGWVNIELGGNTYLRYVSGGDFEFSFPNCDGVESITLYAGDISNAQFGDGITQNVLSAVSFGEINACGTNFANYISLNVDGEETLYIDVGAIEPVSGTISFSGFGGINSLIQIEVMGINGTGTNIPFNGININLSIFETDLAYDLYCNSSTPECTVFDVSITELGTIVGEYISGSITGETEVSINNDPAQMRNYTIEFRTKIF